MRNTVSNGVAAAHANPVSDGLVQHLRTALDRCRAKHAAVAAAIGISAPMLAQVLSGLKPLRAVYVDRLPADVRLELARVFAEANGLTVAPRLTEAEALDLTLRGVLALQHARIHQPSPR